MRLVIFIFDQVFIVQQAEKEMRLRDALDLSRFYVLVKAMVKEGNTIRIFGSRGVFLTH